MNVITVEQIRKALEKPGKTKGDLARAMGVRPGAVSELLSGERQLQLAEMPAAVEYLELDSVALVGNIGAGAVIEPDYEQIPPEGLETIRLPFLVADEVVAFRVKDESMLPRYDDGDVIVVLANSRKTIEDFYNREAAVRTSDGKRYLKKVMPGKSRNTVDLHSYNGAKPIENVKLEWIGEIYMTLPAEQFRRLAAAVPAKGTKG